MSEGLRLPATLDYNEIKNGLRSNIIKEIKQHFEIEKEKYYEKLFFYSRIQLRFNFKKKSSSLDCT